LVRIWENYYFGLCLGSMSWFLKKFRRKIRRKNGDFCTKYCKFIQKMNHNIYFREKRLYFRRKLAKIAQN
jgi:hypothetical protein